MIAYNNEATPSSHCIAPVQERGRDCGILARGREAKFFSRDCDIFQITFFAT